MAITALPTPPSRADAANFAARADAFLGALPTFATEANAVQADVNAKATAAAASALSAVNAPGSSATSTTSLTVGAGARSLAIQTGKSLVVGQWVTIARTSAATNWMAGSITAYNSGSGALTVQVIAYAGAGTFTDWTVALSPPISFMPSTAGQIWAGTDTASAITPAGLFAAAAFVALTDAATIAADFAAGFNFAVTLAGNRTLANPTNAKPGQSGVIEITQDASGSRTLAYGSAWKFPGGAPALTTTAGAIDLLAYTVRSSGVIYATLTKALS